MTLLLKTDSIKETYLQSLFLFLSMVHDWIQPAFQFKTVNVFNLSTTMRRAFASGIVNHNFLRKLHIIAILSNVRASSLFCLSRFLKVCIFYKSFLKTRFSFFRVFCQFCVLNSRSFLKKL